MNEIEFDAMMTDVLGEMANPPMREEFAMQMKNRSWAMRDAMESNVLMFGTLDRTAVGTMSKRSMSSAVLLNLAAALLLIVFMQTSRVLTAGKVETLVSLTMPAPSAPLAPRLSMAGGGGGNTGATPVSKGNPPKFAPQIMPLKAPPTVDAKIHLEPTVDVQTNLKMTKSDVPNFGVSNSPLVGTSLGNGSGGGLGSGNGNGIGPGAGGNIGGGLRRIGGGVSAPVVLFQPEPEFSEEARRAKVAGNVVVYLQVDAQGRAQHVRVLRGIGLGLDEKAIEAVRQYRFKPAMENGRPVPVEMNVEVAFQIF